MPSFTEIAPGQLEMTFSVLETQIGGEHYKGYKIQPIEFFIANGIKAAESYIIKYACRHRDKGGAEDIKKLIHVANLILEIEYGENSNT